MVDRWMENFGKWTPQQQMIFSCIVLCMGLAVILLAGLWAERMMRHAVVLWRGWRPEPGEANPKVMTVAGVPRLMTPVCPGYDWKDEQRQIAEEAKYQADMQAKAQAEMEQSDIAWQLKDKQLREEKKELPAEGAAG